MRKRMTFIVSLEPPPLATKAELRRYVEDAVGCMKGAYRPPGGYGPDDPGDPVFELDGDTVRVRHYTEDPGAAFAAADAHDLLTALKAAKGYLLNAKIDLETGAPKRTALMTIEGGLRMIDAALAKARSE